MFRTDEEIISIFESKLDVWTHTQAHKYDCAAWDEGLYCCLENVPRGEPRKHGRIKIVELLKQSLKLKEDSLKT